MRRTGWSVALAAIVAGCGTESPAPPDPGFRPTASIEEIMRSVVDPAADAVWDAVVIDVTPDGIIETRPETDDDWRTLRRHAVTLVEATNLLLMDGRSIANQGSESELPGIDLEPSEIQALLDEDPESWTRYVDGLYESGREVLAAVDAQDVDALLEAGDRLDLACEACHSRYWYPGFGGRQDELAEMEARGEP